MVHVLIRSCLLALILGLVVVSTSAQDQLVKFYPVGVPKYCKGCGHTGRSFWKLTIRIENISGDNLILYGSQLGGEFYALNMFQRRNPHICEWEYGDGDSVRRVPWKEMKEYEKVPRVLKAGEVLEAEGSYDEWDVKAPTRFTAFVGKPSDSTPTEVFSTPLVPVFGATPDDASFRLVDNVCSPQCKIGISESPKIMGVRLGMTMKDFRVLYPNIKVQRLHKKLANYKVAYISAWSWNAYSVNVTFIDDKVGRIEPTFRSLNESRDREDFWELISSTIGMPYYWEPFLLEWKCQDFVVEVTPNENPTITIQTTEYM
ncbi:MAG: hypothetical protein WBO10_17505, partial [Pyrinomonadaceae bacterium]